jgi:hypothetical protein
MSYDTPVTNVSYDSIVTIASNHNTVTPSVAAHAHLIWVYSRGCNSRDVAKHMQWSCTFQAAATTCAHFIASGIYMYTTGSQVLDILVSLSDSLTTILNAYWKPLEPITNPKMLAAFLLMCLQRRVNKVSLHKRAPYLTC